MITGRLVETNLKLYEVNCSRCPRTQKTESTSRDYAGNTFMRLGWKYIGGRGWTCSECASRALRTRN